MKRLLIPFFLIFFVSLPITMKAQKVVDAPKETMPLFDGAKSNEETQQKLFKYFTTKASSEETKNKGTVLVRFFVDSIGDAVSPEVFKSPSEELSELAIKYVNEMPKWTPGRQGNKNVKTQYTVPIIFR